MQSEDFDKKIRDAAENHHPSYNEKAWNKMENLLDKHLPTEKDNRRRIIFFVLLFLLVGGGTWLFISKPWKTTPVLSQTTTETAAKPNGSISSSTTNSQPGTTGTEAGEVVAHPSSSNNRGSEPATPHVQGPATPGQPGQVDRPANTPVNEFSVTTTQAPARKKAGEQAGDDFGIVTGAPGKKQKAKKDQQPQLPATTPVIAETQQIETPKNNTSEETAKKQTDIVEPAREKKDVVPPPVNTDKPVTNTEKTEQPKDEPAKDSVTTPTKASKKKKKKGPTENGLAVTVSGGADLSFVGSRTGEWRPVVGAGLSYTFAKRFTLRTGFYTANKVYSASPEDYKPKTPPPTPQYLKLIDAECKVYEIPVSLAWQFAKSKKGSWFGAAGLSSYIMKEEKYDYLYEYPGGPPWTYNWELRNKNKHLFSVLSLSAGYNRKLGRIFSVTAEPYFKMPLNGVGFGKVKLNSTGVLVTLSAKLTGN